MYIKKWLGGVRKLRQILGQEGVSTKVWDKEIAISELKEWYDRYGCTPGSAVARYKSGTLELTKEEYLKVSLNYAIYKHVGTISEAMNILRH
ncbi:hypothetical protein [Paenibacillus hubeiensis]|uniref:hypothetical protein n=1 Tax=Paenibacillus hubeiensis TaxID=3077330 RepID=UPI0031BBCDCF